MMSCGKKKRESVSERNQTFYENIPGDFAGAVKYFRETEPLNPMLSNDEFLRKMLEEDERSFRLNSHVPKLLLFEASTETTRPSTQSSPTNSKKLSVLINKLLIKDRGNSLGIPGFPDDWDVDEIYDEKINENHRREIDRLIEECCKVPPVTTCNGNTFLGACK
ncbi:hypothetical protein RUM43_006316 [Polyplax serrata]|uniref:Uncharacterized protein n=1 Tax=Polyplax serrata TaxID=468196 RepID=A0AAN8NRT6_POLSC